ncbi:MAG: cell division protein ZapA [Polyangiaceae bacterium]|jgi:cell division protein ZapA
MSRTVELRVGGQNYRVVSSAPEAELQRLAAVLNERLAAIAPSGRGTAPMGLVLVAMGLAHDLEVERGAREALQERTRDFLRGLLVRCDDLAGGEWGPGGRASEE